MLWLPKQASVAKKRTRHQAKWLAETIRSTPVSLVGMQTLAPALAELSPMLLSQPKRPFTEEGWTLELKYDGWRCLAEVNAGKVRLQSRRGNDASRPCRR